jgi:Ca-activated chloride channel family protein
MLLVLLAVPVVIGLYLSINRKRSLRAANFFSAQPSRSQAPVSRRHIPAALFLTSLVIILVSLARPQAEVKLPRVEGTVMLVFDVSASMKAEDVEPSRIEAAKAAAREFVLSQPETVKIGIVSFSSSGFTVQSPTNDPNLLLAAINRLQPTSGTSLGQGILAALHTIAVDAGLAEEAQPTPEEPSTAGNPSQDPQQQMRAEDRLLEQLPDGPYPPSVIVLITDGENNQSVDPLRAATAAAEREVRIDALGFGTTAGADIEVDGFIVHTVLDETTLQLITQAAGGTYYAAQDEQDPQAVYANLVPQLVVKPELMEMTALFAGAGILLLLLGGVFSMLWLNRLP